MATGKRYYWLKLNEDFFTTKEIKKLRRIAGGDTYTVIYLKMLLRSLRSDGRLFYEGIEENFPAELALDIDEDLENVKVTVSYLLSCGILVTSNNEEFELVTAHEMTGSMTDGADRVRRFRQREQVGQALLCNTDVTARNADVTASNKNVTLEKEKEKERREKNREVREESPDNREESVDLIPTLQEINNTVGSEGGVGGTDKPPHATESKRFRPPSVEEVSTYVQQRGSDVDPQRFVDFYASKGWMVGRHKMVDWKASVRTWEQRDRQSAQEPKGERRIYGPDGYPYKGAKYLANCIAANYPDAKPTSEDTIQEWADIFRRMNEEDGYEWLTISNVLAWSQDDPFWKKIILSAQEFRDKFLKLLAGEQSAR